MPTLLHAQCSGWLPWVAHTQSSGSADLRGVWSRCVLQGGLPVAERSYIQQTHWWDKSPWCADHRYSNGIYDSHGTNKPKSLNAGGGRRPVKQFVTEAENESVSGRSFCGPEKLELAVGLYKQEVLVKPEHDLEAWEVNVSLSVGPDRLWTGSPRWES